MRSVREVSDKMTVQQLCMRKTGARNVYCLHTVDCLEFKYLAREINITGTIKEEKHCSLKDEDFHESQLQVDHKSLLGCHRDDEDECVVEEG